MGKSRDLFKKIRGTKGIFHAKMVSIKDRNGMDLTEAEDIKRYREYTEELYRKDLHDPSWAPSHVGLRSHDKLVDMATLHTPDGNSARKEERKDHTGETSLSSDWFILYCLGKLFILLVVHRDQWIIQSYAVSAALTLLEPRLSLCIPSCIHKS